ncbi:replication-relaxation family protein (plasmid) [Aneurinibacillus sp. Ricciae_BoGa-3]|uniref:replication-relaxation family protein n=1 Tax=Aneurinibacillus sp. Ricciae_BoGa-3 TaxID=3022697 RepID=UPI002341C7C8|nr:replication-relaxation family protein [Aneurinibacillus sp. Ricciae_BoGa-3]WCK57743.1 replication-relaxation family protein [Aneurinibacillus sp. Ricciae_BoGa-3]
MKNAIKDILKSLSQRDVEALRSIYMFRCLTQQQLYQLHYSKSLLTNEAISNETAIKKISELLSFHLIEEVERITKIFGESEPVYFLTPLGIEVIRYCFDLPTNIYDAKKQVVKRGYYRASELKIYPKNINHQVHQNQFVIDFMLQNEGVNWKYYDEKYVGQFTSIRPDGMITMLDTDFFIEMDMATESKKQLFEKWENYRNFLNSREYAYKERKIVVLFICDGTARTQERADLVRYTIYERIIDIMDADFEIYIGTKEELLTLLHDKLIPSLKGELPIYRSIQQIFTEKHSFDVASGYILKDTFEGTEHGLYIRKVKDNNHILVENKRVQEFVVDEYSYSPLSVISKIAYSDKHNAFFKRKFNRDICYIVIAESEQQIQRDLKVVDLIGVKNVYFTTFERLNSLPFHEALFQFDFLGNIHHFANSGLEERIFEQTMKIEA